MPVVLPSSMQVPYGRTATAPDPHRMARLLRLFLFTLALCLTILLAALPGARAAEDIPEPHDPPPPPPPLVPGPRLKIVLERKLTPAFREATLPELLENLQCRAGLDYAFPAALAACREFSLEGDPLTVHEILDKLAAADSLVLACDGDRLLLWQPKDTRVLETAERMLRDGNEQAQCEAAFELCRDADPRAFPLLADALARDFGPVTVYILRGLCANQADVLGPGLDAPTRKRFHDALMKLWNLPAASAHKGELLALLGAVRDPRALDLLLAQLEANQFRQTAAQGLGRIGDPKAVPALLALMRDPVAEPEEYTAAAYALGQLGSATDGQTVEAVLPSAGAAKIGEIGCQAIVGAYRHGHDALNVTALRDLLKVPSPEVRSCAVYVLVQSDDEADVTLALAALAAGPEIVRERAALGLMNSPSPQADAALVALLKDADKGVRANAALALAGRPVQAAVAPLIELLTNDDRELQDAAMAALRESLDPAAYDALLKQAKDGPVDRRQALTACLGQTRDPRALTALTGLLKSGELKVRSGAVSGLGLTRDFRAVNLLADWFTKPGNGGEYYVVNGLTEFGLPRHRDWLAGLQKTEHKGLQLMLSELLASQGDLRGMDILMADLHTPESFNPSLTYLLMDRRNEQARAAELISQLGPKGNMALVDILEVGPAGLQTAAAQGLAESGEPRAVLPLIAVLKSARQDFRLHQAVTGALRKLADSRAIPALAAELQAPEENFRRNAELALDDWDDPAAKKALATYRAHPQPVPQPEPAP